VHVSSDLEMPRVKFRRASADLRVVKAKNGRWVTVHFLLIFRWLHRALLISRFGFMNKRAAWCGMLVVVIAWLLSACASTPEEGVVIDKPGAGSEPAPFQRPTFHPGEEGVSSAHF